MTFLITTTWQAATTFTSCNLFTLYKNPKPASKARHDSHLKCGFYRERYPAVQFFFGMHSHNFWLLHLKERGPSPSSRNVAILGMKFFFATEKRELAIVTFEPRIAVGYQPKLFETLRSGGKIAQDACLPSYFIAIRGASRVTAKALLSDVLIPRRYFSIQYLF